MEPRNGCRLCMRDLPPGAANSRDGLRRRASPPSGRLTLQILHPPKTSRDWDKSDPTQSTAIDALSASVLSGLFPSRKNLLRGKKTLAVERNVTRYNVAHARALGSETVLDYQAGRFEDAADSVDLVLDTVGGETRERSLNLLKT